MVGDPPRQGPRDRSNDLANLRTFLQVVSPRGAPRRRPDNPTDAPKVDKGLPCPPPAPTCTVSRPSSPTTYAAPSSLGAYAAQRLRSRRPPLARRRPRGSPRPHPPRQRRKSWLVALGAVLIGPQILPTHGGNVVTGTKQSMSAALQRRINRAIASGRHRRDLPSTRHRYGCRHTTAARDPAVGRQMATLARHDNNIAAACRTTRRTSLAGGSSKVKRATTEKSGTHARSSSSGFGRVSTGRATVGCGWA